MDVFPQYPSCIHSAIVVLVYFHKMDNNIDSAINEYNIQFYKMDNIL